MALIFIPPQLREVAAGTSTVELPARSVREAIAMLDEQFPGIGPRLSQNDELRPGLSVSVGGRVSSLGVYQKLKPEDEVHFIPALGGG